MAEYAVETRSYEPKNFFAGEFPTLTEKGTAGETIGEHTLVAMDSSGNIIEAVAPAEGKTISVIGIAETAAEKDEPVVYWITGEFFADAITYPTDVTAADVKDVLRQMSIFLR